MDGDGLDNKNYSLWLIIVFAIATFTGCVATPGREQPLGGIVTSVFSPDGKLIAASTGEGEVAIFDTHPLWFRRMLTNESDKLALHGYSEIIAASFRPLPLAFSPDGKVLVAGGVAGSIVAWDVGTGAEKFRVPTNGSIRDVVFLADGHSFVTVGPIVAIRGIGDGLVANKLAIPADAEASSVAVSPDGQLLIIGVSTGEIAVYDVSSRLLLNAFKGHAVPVTGIAYKADGTLFASTAGGYDLQFWKRNAAGNFEKTSPPLAAASVAQDSVGLAQGGGLLLWLLGTVSGARLVGAPTMGAPPILAGAEAQFAKAARATPYHCGSRVAFSANGRYVASTANLLACPDCLGGLAPAFMLFVIDLESGASATARDRGCSVSLSPDGRIVATGGVAGAPALLDSSTGDPLPSPK